MAGQPMIFDWATTIPVEGPAGIPLTPPYAVISAVGTLSLRSYFHCGGRDRVQRARIAAALAGATVTYFLRSLQADVPFIMVAGTAPVAMAAGAVQAEFQGAGDLAGSGLDPTDDYYRSADTIVAGFPLTGTTETWRVLTVFRGAPGSGVSAFDDSLVVQRLA